MDPGYPHGTAAWPWHGAMRSSVRKTLVLALLFLRVLFTTDLGRIVAAALPSGYTAL
jgi:hypothetical protein